MTRLGSRDTLLVRAPDSSSKGCQFQSRQVIERLPVPIPAGHRQVASSNPGRSSTGCQFQSRQVIDRLPVPIPAGHGQVASSNPGRSWTGCQFQSRQVMDRLPVPIPAGHGQVASSNPGRSGGTLFSFSPESTLSADSYSVSVPPPCYRSGT